MATSGTYSYNQNVQSLVYDVLDQAGISGLGRTPATEDYNKVVRIINRMIKTWSTEGLLMWSKEEAILFLTQYQSKYVIGSTGSAYCCSASDQVITKINGALTSGDTSVTVDSTTGMTIGDSIGIVLSDNSTHWTTIATIPDSVSITLTLGVTGDSANDSLVFSFTNKIFKPLRILSARLVNGYDSGATSTLNERILAVESYDTYNNLANKTSNGTPSMVMYDPRNSTGDMYVWTRPDNTNYRIAFSYERYIEDIAEVNEDFDFPPEWLEPLLYNAAWRTALMYNKVNKAKMIEGVAMESFAYLKNAAFELASITISPDNPDY